MDRQLTDHHATPGPDPAKAGSNASGSQTADSAQTVDAVDSGQSDDIENSLTGQGVSDRATIDDEE